MPEQYFMYRLWLVMYWKHWWALLYLRPVLGETVVLTRKPCTMREQVWLPELVPGCRLPRATESSRRLVQQVLGTMEQVQQAPWWKTWVHKQRTVALKERCFLLHHGFTNTRTNTRVQQAFWWKTESVSKEQWPWERGVFAWWWVH